MIKLMSVYDHEQEVTLIIKSRMFLSSVPLLLYRLVLLLPCSFLTNQIQGVSGKKWGQFEFHINDSHYMQIQTVSNSAVKAKSTCTSCHFPKQVIVIWYNHEFHWNSVFILKVHNHENEFFSCHNPKSSQSWHISHLFDSSNQ